jgi:hypothetical protein
MYFNMKICKIDIVTNDARHKRVNSAKIKNGQLFESVRQWIISRCHLSDG